MNPDLADQLFRYLWRRRGAAAGKAAAPRQRVPKEYEREYDRAYNDAWHEHHYYPNLRRDAGKETTDG